MIRAVQATAPLAVELAEGVAVALDRRVWCRVEPAPGGFVFENRTSLRRVRAATLAEAEAAGGDEPAVGLWRALGGFPEAQVAVQPRVGNELGLGVVEALAVALAGALEAVTGSGGRAEALDRGPLRRAALAASRYGGVVGISRLADRPWGRRLRADPARVEEWLLLIDLPGTAEEAAASVKAAPARGGDAALARRVREALEDARYSDVGRLLAQEAGPDREGMGAAPSAWSRLASAARARGGAVLRLGRAASGGLLWVAPAGRGEVLAVACQAGARVLPVRLDLLGLEVEAEGEKKVQSRVPL